MNCCLSVSTTFGSSRGRGHQLPKTDAKVTVELVGGGTGDEAEHDQNHVELLFRGNLQFQCGIYHLHQPINISRQNRGTLIGEWKRATGPRPRNVLAWHWGIYCYTLLWMDGWMKEILTGDVRKALRQRGHGESTGEGSGQED